MRWREVMLTHWSCLHILVKCPNWRYLCIVQQCEHLCCSFTCGFSCWFLDVAGYCELSCLCFCMPSTSSFGFSSSSTCFWEISAAMHVAINLSSVKSRCCVSYSYDTFASESVFFSLQSRIFLLSSKGLLQTRRMFGFLFASMC